MIVGQDITAKTTSGTIEYIQPDSGPGGDFGVPGYFFAGTEYEFDSFQRSYNRIFLAFDLSSVPQNAKLISCMIVLTGASDPDCPIYYVPYSWTEPITTAKHTKWQAAGDTSNKVVFQKSGDNGPNISYTLNLLDLGHNRASLGQRFACAVVRENDMIHDEQYMGDKWGVLISDLDTVDPLKRPRLSIAYRVPANLMPRGRSAEYMNPPMLEKGSKISLNVKDSKLQ